MKNLKRIASLVLALVMVFSLAISASAAVVINPTDHSYKAYQVFSGTQAEGSKVLGDIVWGSGVNGAQLLADLKAATDIKVSVANEEGTGTTETTIAALFTECATAKDVAEVLDDNSAMDNPVAKAFANIAADNIAGEGITVAATTELADGYYLFVDVTEDVSGDAHNSALLQVTGDDKVEITVKYSVPSPDKDITAVTHIETKTTFTGTEAVDAEIGDTVEFTLTGTLPTNYADYETYVYNFHDTLSDGMTLVTDNATTTDVNEGVKVYVVNGTTSTDVTESFTVTTTTCTKTGCNCNLQISCANLKAITGVTINKDSVIKVVYSAKLNGNAVIGEDGNPNTMYIEYSNNPNKDSDGTPDTGNTPTDEVLVFTYELDTTKIDGATAEAQDPTELSGAEFVLLNSDTSKVATVVDGKLTGWVDVPEAVDGKITWPENTTLTSGADGKFIVKGLDAGTYKLRETKAPAGYNLLTEDVTIVIAATIKPVDGTEGVVDLEALTIKVDDATAVDGAKDNNGDYTGVLAATIENNQGGTLPETGGIGTTLFYIVGGILVLAAVVLLVTKKRMSVAE